MNLKPYAKYKPSGVEWLGDVPSHWEETKLKHKSTFITGWTPPTGQDELFDGENLWANISDLGPKVLFDTTKRISDAAVQRTNIPVVSKGSLLFSFKLSIGQVSFAGRPMYTNEAIAAFPPSGVLSLAYAYYAFPLFLVQNAAVNIYGAKLLNQQLIRDAYLVCPPVQEQSAIAAFLDRETAKIDTLIAKQEKLIELLQEKRQAVISHAVTKGLDESVPMKPSGVEWLGDVPERWRMCRAKHVSEVFVPQRNKPELNETVGTPWVTMEDMGNAKLKASRYRVESAAATEAGSRLLPSGSVIASCVGSFGVSSINDEPVIINQQLQAYIPRGILPDFLRLVVSVSSAYFEMVGTAATLVYVNQDGFANLPVPAPHIDEQAQILKYIDQQLAMLDTLIAKAQQAIELQKEHRTALISSAVTGKIDVRGMVDQGSYEEKAA